MNSAMRLGWAKLAKREDTKPEEGMRRVKKWQRFMN